MKRIFMSMLLLVGLIVVLCQTSCQSEKAKAEGEEETNFLVTSPLKKDTLLTKE